MFKSKKKIENIDDIAYQNYVYHFYSLAGPGSIPFTFSDFIINSTYENNYKNGYEFYYINPISFFRDMKYKKKTETIDEIAYKYYVSDFLNLCGHNCIPYDFFEFMISVKYEDNYKNFYEKFYNKSNSFIRKEKLEKLNGIQ